MLPTDSAAPAAGHPRLPIHGRRWRPGSTGRVLLAMAVAIMATLAALGTLAYVETHPTGKPTLVVYTYDSLFGGCGSSLLRNLTAAFESTHPVHLDFQCQSGTLSTLLIAQKNAPAADLVVGLDEITAPQAEAAGVLIPYTSPQLSNVPLPLVAQLSPGHAVTPYESGYLAIDYSPEFYNATGGSIANFSLPGLASNSTWARALMMENPESDIVGQEFLLSQIAFYQSVMHSDWGPFWKAVDPFVRVNGSWTDVYGAFGTTGPNPPGMIVSFNTDPASSGTIPPSFNATLYHWNGSTYAWRTIYGVGIVQGTHHLALDQEFVDWFLGRTVQTAVPTGEWEFPANQTIPLPDVFRWAVDPPGVILLNAAIPPASIPGSLGGPGGWLDRWQNLENLAHP